MRKFKKFLINWIYRQLTIILWTIIIFISALFFKFSEEIEETRKSTITRIDFGFNNFNLPSYYVTFKDGHMLITGNLKGQDVGDTCNYKVKTTRPISDNTKNRKVLTLIYIEFIVFLLLILGIVDIKRVHGKLYIIHLSRIKINFTSDVYKVLKISHNFKQKYSTSKFIVLGNELEECEEFLNNLKSTQNNGKTNYLK